MIELTYYEKKKLKLTASQLLDLDAKVRKELSVGDDDCILVHDILIHAHKHGFLRLPAPENIEPDDDCVPPSKSHLGFTRAELVAWVREQQGKQTEGVPNIFEDLDK